MTQEPASIDMDAFVIRRERYGEPLAAIQKERVTVPRLGDNQVLVKVMAAGLNYNNVWAASGQPVDVIARRQRQQPDAPDFHIGGSEAAGVVHAVGRRVNRVRVGDEVVVSCSVYDASDHEARCAYDSMFTRTQEIYGYEVNYGSFAEFTRVEDYQCFPKPRFLTWEESASLMLNGPTAYKQLTHWCPNTVKPGDPVLVWGAAGGLGSMSIQIVKALGGVPIGVVSSEERGRYIKTLGAEGYLVRPHYRNLTALPDVDSHDHRLWRHAFSEFKKDYFQVLGAKRLPKIVVEHTGHSTFATSVQICDRAGMVVSVGGTSGYNCNFDVRHLWMHQKRVQGSHYANLAQCEQFLQLVGERKVHPTLNTVYPFSDVAKAHQDLYDGRLVGNASILVNAEESGMGSERDIHCVHRPSSEVDTEASNYE